MATPLNNFSVGRIASKLFTFRGIVQPIKTFVPPNPFQTYFSSVCALHSIARVDILSFKTQPSSKLASQGVNNLPSSNVWPQRKGLLSATQPPLIQSVRHRVSLHPKRLTQKQKTHRIIKKLVGTWYEYSGDLRKIKDFPKDATFYPFEAFEDELKDDEVLKKLASLEFATDEQKYEHKKKIVLERIIELFGQDSELEQRIAEDTLFIRSTIPIVFRDYYVTMNRKRKKYKQFMAYHRILQRREDLAYLRKIDHERFEWLLRELKIQYVIPKEGQPLFAKEKDVEREKTLNAAAADKRKKLEELKIQLDKEKEEFYEHKAKVMSEMDRDLQNFGLTREHLKAMIEEDVEKKTPKKYNDLLWEERVQLGISGKLNKLI